MTPSLRTDLVVRLAVATDHPATQRSPILYVLYVLSALGLVLLVYVVAQAVRRNKRP